MFRLLVTMIFFSFLGSAFALELDYSYGFRKYNFLAGDSEFKLKSPRMRLSIKRAKCNDRNLKRYKEKIVHFLGKYSHQELHSDLSSKESLSKIVYKIDDSKKYVTGTKTEIGQILLKIPNDFVALKKQSCSP